MPGENSRPIADVLQDIVGNVQKIVRAEVKLAKAEVKEEASKAGRAAGMMAAGAVSAIYALGLLLLTILFALAQIMPLWLAALILFVLLAVVTAILLGIGRKRFRAVHATPEKTVETMKENVEWVKRQTK
jgi:uncharacterized membrane protein YqjE